MNNKGFTLIEILAVIAIIGLLAAVIVPNLGKRSPAYERRATLAKLNGLTQLAWKNALIYNKIYAVEIDNKKKQISLNVATGKYKDGSPEIKPVEKEYLETLVPWPENLEIKKVVIEGKDEPVPFERLFFFIMPDGLAQDVILNIIDMKDIGADGQPKQFGLVLNPFNAQFTVYDTFQK